MGEREETPLICMLVLYEQCSVDCSSVSSTAEVQQLGFPNR